jgi:hypothetical protein
MKVRCRICGGSKKRQGMGMMVKDCDVCDEKGYVEKVVLETVPELDVYEAIADESEVASMADVVEASTDDAFAVVESSEDTCTLEDIFPGVTEGAKEFTDGFTGKKKGRPKKSK